MTLRVIQWATGSVGAAAIKGVLEHPELELVGCWVHSEAKSGRDVGEIIGTSPLGVTATHSVDEMLALSADAVIYAPLLPSVKEVAAQAGNSTLHGAGIGPGAATELFPLLLSVMSTGVTFIRAEEFSDLRSYGAPDVLRHVMGFGGTPDSALTGPMQKLLDGGFVQSVRLCVDQLGFAADPDIRSFQEVAVAAAAIDSPIGLIEPGQVAGRRFHWQAVVGDTIVVQINLCEQKGWQPESVQAGLRSNPGIVATAAHCVNAIRRPARRRRVCKDSSICRSSPAGPPHSWRAQEHAEEQGCRWLSRLSSRNRAS